MKKKKKELIAIRVKSEEHMNEVVELIEIAFWELTRQPDYDGVANPKAFPIPVAMMKESILRRPKHPGVPGLGPFPATLFVCDFGYRHKE